MSENSGKISKAIELVEKAQHVGILLPPEAGVDELVSAEVLWKILGARGKQIGLLSGPSQISLSEDTIKNIAHPQTLPREFIISLDTSTAPVSEMRYEKEEERLNIILSPASSSIGEGAISYKSGRTLCDAAILVGVKDLEGLKSEKIEPAFFTQTPIINLDVSPENKLYGDADLVDMEKISIAEVVYEFLTDLTGQPLGKEEATLLLTGLVEKSKGFSPDSTNADLLLASSELMRLGADYSLARTMARGELPIGLLQLAGRAAVRSRMDDSRGVLWSFLTPEDFEKTGRGVQDANRTIGYLDSLFGKHRVTALLLQSEKDHPVQALLSGESKILEAMKEREPGTFQSPYLLLSTPFPSFRDAEEYLSSLLEAIL